MKTEMLAQISKTREYLDYIEEHYTNVQTAWETIKAACSDMEFMHDSSILDILNKEIREHDLSKLSKEEFVQYRQVFFPTDSESYELTDAWEHHKANNRHHWETWTADMDIENHVRLTCDLIHNIVDWTAMSIKFGNAAREYYEKNKIKFPKWAIGLMNEIFDRIY